MITPKDRSTEVHYLPRRYLAPHDLDPADFPVTSDISAVTCETCLHLLARRLNRP